MVILSYYPVAIIIITPKVNPVELQDRTIFEMDLNFTSIVLEYNIKRAYS